MPSPCFWRDKDLPRLLFLPTAPVCLSVKKTIMHPKILNVVLLLEFMDVTASSMIVMTSQEHGTLRTFKWAKLQSNSKKPDQILFIKQSPHQLDMVPKKIQWMVFFHSTLRSPRLTWRRSSNKTCTSSASMPNWYQLNLMMKPALLLSHSSAVMTPSKSMKSATRIVDVLVESSWNVKNTDLP